MRIADDKLLLHHRLRALDDATLHCREIELRLSADHRQLILSRYVELYGDDRCLWGAVNHHQVSLTSMIRWMIRHGKQHPPLGSPLV
ncbi:hypothetical protein [Stutzerimonas azotifigens]|uniref:hypothetical protein n=1 Tax=Stutzerimonas azotifigens TaxID=291995 RepID=UPI00041DDE90|nr:hypothetical protein [Stutzerimonas azotifigens]